MNVEDKIGPLEHKLVTLDAPLKLAIAEKQKYEVNQLVKRTYNSIYPDITQFHDSPFDNQAYILCSFSEHGQANSSARLVIDSTLGLPEDAYFPKEINMLRDQGKKIMEFGRFIILPEAPVTLSVFYKNIVKIAIAESIDVIVMAMKEHHIAFHRNKIGAYSLGDMNLTYGGKDSLHCVCWEIKSTKPRFFQWAGLDTKKLGEWL